MYFNAIWENKILTKISQFTVVGNHITYFIHRAILTSIHFEPLTITTTTLDATALFTAQLYLNPKPCLDRAARPREYKTTFYPAHKC